MQIEKCVQVHVNVCVEVCEEMCAVWNVKRCVQYET